MQPQALLVPLVSMPPENREQVSKSGQRAGAGQEEPRRVAPSQGSASSGLNPPHFSSFLPGLNPPIPQSLPLSVAKLATVKSPRESPRAKRNVTWLDRHIGALNCLGLSSFNSQPTMGALRAKYRLAIAGIAEATGSSKRTVARCYDGKPVRRSTLLRCAQAARIGGFGEPPGAPRYVRE